jgi:hypothetical protein
MSNGLAQSCLINAMSFMVLFRLTIGTRTQIKGQCSC